MRSEKGKKPMRLYVLVFASLLHFSTAGVSNVYSSPALTGSTSVNPYQQSPPSRSQVNTWAQYPLKSSYLPQAQVQTQVQPQIQPQTQTQFQGQVQSQIQPQIQAQFQGQVQPQIQPQTQTQFQGQEQPQISPSLGGLRLSPLPTQSIFSPSQPINFNLPGQNSFFYSPRDQAVYKVTKISLNPEKFNAQHGASPPPAPTQTTTSATQPPVQESESQNDSFGLLPPTPSIPNPLIPSNRRPSYRDRPVYSINFTVYENNGPQPSSDCRGGGEGRNPGLNPIFGAEGDDAGCPPAPAPGGSPQVGVPEPIIQDPESSQTSPQFQVPPPQSEDGTSGKGVRPVPGEVLSSKYGAPPATEYGPPPKYGPPPPAPAPAKRPRDDNGIAGGGARSSSTAQANGVVFMAAGTVG